MGQDCIKLFFMTTKRLQFHQGVSAFTQGLNPPTWTPHSTREIMAIMATQITHMKLLFHADNECVQQTFVGDHDPWRIAILPLPSSDLISMQELQQDSVTSLMKNATFFILFLWQSNAVMERASPSSGKQKQCVVLKSTMMSWMHTAQSKRLKYWRFAAWRVSPIHLDS